MVRHRGRRYRRTSEYVDAEGFAGLPMHRMAYATGHEGHATVGLFSKRRDL